MPDLNVADVDIDISKLNTKLVSESWSVDLQDYIIDLAWSPDASKLAAITVEGSVFLFNVQDKSDKSNLIGQHDKGANSLSWRSDSTEFATAGHDGLVKVWDSSNGKDICWSGLCVLCCVLHLYLLLSAKVISRSYPRPHQ